MKETTKINIIIDGVKHEMNVDPKQEQNIRKAGRLVDERMITVKSRWRVGANNDYMTMVAFELAYEKIMQNVQSDEGDVCSKLRNILSKLEKSETIDKEVE